MLVLIRRAGERVRLLAADGTAVWLTVIEIRRDGMVRLGIDAPPSVDIRREELLLPREPGAGPRPE